jgi:hypothetical protein
VWVLCICGGCRGSGEPIGAVASDLLEEDWELSLSLPPGLEEDSEIGDTAGLEDLTGDDQAPVTANTVSGDTDDDNNECDERSNFCDVLTSTCQLTPMPTCMCLHGLIPNPDDTTSCILPAETLATYYDDDDWMNLVGAIPIHRYPDSDSPTPSPVIDTDDDWMKLPTIKITAGMTVFGLSFALFKTPAVQTGFVNTLAAQVGVTADHIRIDNVQVHDELSSRQLTDVVRSDVNHIHIDGVSVSYAVTGLEASTAEAAAYAIDSVASDPTEFISALVSSWAVAAVTVAQIFVRASVAIMSDIDGEIISIDGETIDEPAEFVTDDGCTDEVWSIELGETDVDCGGGQCRGCSFGQQCYSDADCYSENCFEFSGVAKCATAVTDDDDGAGSSSSFDESIGSFPSFDWQKGSYDWKESSFTPPSETPTPSPTLPTLSPTPPTPPPTPPTPSPTPPTPAPTLPTPAPSAPTPHPTIVPTPAPSAPPTPPPTLPPSPPTLTPTAAIIIPTPAAAAFTPAADDSTSNGPTPCDGGAHGCDTVSTICITYVYGGLQIPSCQCLPSFKDSLDGGCLPM